MKYIDALIYVSSFNDAIAELYQSGMEELLTFDEENGLPTGLNNRICRVYPSTAWDIPAVLHTRMKNEDWIKIAKVEKEDGTYSKRLYNHIQMLVEIPAEGDKVQTGVDEEGNPTYRTVRIWEKLKNAASACALYMTVVCHPEQVEDADGNLVPNPKLQPTIEADDGEGNMVSIPNPQYNPLRKLPRWA